MVRSGFEPGLRGWKAQTNLAAPPQSRLSSFQNATGLFQASIVQPFSTFVSASRAQIWARMNRWEIRWNVKSSQSLRILESLGGVTVHFKTWINGNTNTHCASVMPSSHICHQTRPIIHLFCTRSRTWTKQLTTCADTSLHLPLPSCLAPRVRQLKYWPFSTKAKENKRFVWKYRAMKTGPAFINASLVSWLPDVFKLNFILSTVFQSKKIPDKHLINVWLGRTRGANLNKNKDRCWQSPNRNSTSTIKWPI